MDLDVDGLGLVDLPQSPDKFLWDSGLSKSWPDARTACYGEEYDMFNIESDEDRTFLQNQCESLSIHCLFFISVTERQTINGSSTVLKQD